jgi:ketosteroid isomerase-like protein
MIEMKFIFIILLFVFPCIVSAQGQEENQIIRILQVQTEAWNRGDVDGFMQTYWKSDSLLFIGKNGVNHGWTSALNHYKKDYPDTTAMGQLKFDIIHVKKLSPEYAYVVGKWMLTRSIGNLSGHFDILLKKIKGKWLIVADHSS